MTTLYIRLPVVVDDADPMRCGACAAYDAPVIEGDDVGVCRSPWFISHSDPDYYAEPMSYHYEVIDRRRHAACLAATNAAIDAEIAASVSGMRHAMDLIDEHGTGVSQSVDRALVEAEIARLEARKVKP